MKKHLRKICLLTVGVLLMSVLFCFGASALTEGNYTYIVENGEATITKVSTSVTGELTTPKTLGGYPVTAIRGFTFDGCTGLTKVTVSEGVKSLGYGTFSGCSNLGTIVLSDSVTTVEYEAVSETKWYSLQPNGIVYLNGVVIGYKGSMPANSSLTLKAGTKAIASGAFKDQTNLIGISFPEGFEAIGTEAFSGCYNIKSLALPSSLKAINGMAFYNCSKITSVTLPENLTNIEYYAFDGCSALKEIIFNTVNEITDNSGFFGCDNVETVKFSKDAKSFAPTALTGGKIKSFSVEAGNTSFSVDTDGVLFNSDKTVLLKYPTGNSRITYTVPSGVKTIAKEAFKKASYLSIVNISGSVEAVEEKAFESCGSLTTVKFEKGTRSIGDSVFSSCEALTNITLPEGLVSLGQRVFNSASKLKAVVIPEGVKEIPDFAFFGCATLNSVTIPETVTRIGWSAFNGCTSLMNINLPGSVSDVAQYSFDNTGWYNAQSDFSAAYLGKVLYKYKVVDYENEPNNSTVTVKDGTELIASGAFSYNGKILKIVMPSSVNRIGDEAFSGCTNLSSVSFSNAVEHIGERAFLGCEKLYSVNLPSALKTIGSEAFRLCSTLSSVSFPKSLEKIGDGAFDLCNIKSFSVDSANESFTAVSGVLYSKDKTALYLYPSANTATSFSVPAGVTEIGAHAFYNATKLTSISIPSSVVKVGKNAFEFSGWLEKQADGTVYTGSALYTYKGDPSENASIAVRTGTVGIAEEAFSGKGNITKISFPDSLKYIGEKALNGTDWFEGLPNGIVMAGKVVYTYKGDMPENTALTIKDASAVADGAFRDCENLKEVVLGEGVAALGEDAFSGCDNLSKLTVENAQCEINSSSDTIPKGATIVAPANSTAQKYAESQGKEYSSYCYHNNTKATEEVKPGCTASGFTAGVYCNDCQKYISGHEEVPAAGHKEAVVPAVEATCKSAGLTEGKKCSVCGTVLVAQTATDKKAHTEEKLPKKEATCTETGLTEGKKCSVCGEVLVAQTTVPAPGHSEYTLRGEEASCTQPGITEGKKCSVCGTVTVKQSEIPAYGHTFVISGDKRICTECGEKLASSHTHTEAVIPAKNPTCTETGFTEGKKCSVCGDIIVAQKEVPAKGHDFKASGDNKVCSVCGFTVDGQHTHTEILLEGRAATCTASGLTYGKKCTVCGDITLAQTVIPAKGHTEVTLPAKSATYTATGLTEGKKCSVCDTVTLAQKKVSRKKLKKASGLKVKSTTTTSVKLSWSKVTGADSYKVYYSTNGKKWKSVKTTKTTYTVKKLTSGKNYQFKVRAFAGKYYGTASSIVKTATKVKKVTLSSVKSSKAEAAAVNWKTVSGASGYVVEYSTSKKFKNKKTVTLKKGTTKKTTLKKLKSGKKYYVRVRAYKTVNGKKVYGSYSSVKTVTVK